MDSPMSTYHEMVSEYVSVGGLAVLTWDILDNIPEDYRLLFSPQQRKLSLPTIIYVLSRLGTFAYTLLSVVFDTAPVGHCRTLALIALSWCPISFGATALLFFLRLRAVYNRDRIIVCIFFALWLVLLTGSALGPIASKGGPVLSPDGIATRYCEERSVTAFSPYGGMSPLVYDTFVLLAISWRLSSISSRHDTNLKVGKRVNVMFLGTDLPTFTRSLLVDGQIYYLVTVITGIACAVLLFSPIIPSHLSVMLEDVYPVVVNIMACRLFRRTKCGTIREAEISSSVINQRNHSAIHFAGSHTTFAETETTAVTQAV